MKACLLAVCLTHYFAIFQAGAAELPLVSRWTWTQVTGAIDNSLRQPSAIRLITIHETEGRNPDRMSQSQEKAALRSILHSHQTTKRSNNEGKVWGDIAYHYIIGPSGNIYRCRDPAYQSDSATVLRSELRGNITVCLMGDFRNRQEKAGDHPPSTAPDQLPSPAAIESLTSLIARELHRNGLGLKSVKAHRELKMIPIGSDCPGGLLYARLRTDVFPSIDAKLRALRN